MGSWTTASHHPPTGSDPGLGLFGSGNLFIALGLTAKEFMWFWCFMKILTVTMNTQEEKKISKK